MSALEERRQRAREAYYDADGYDDDMHAAEAAIETATRVKITPEIMRAAERVSLFSVSVEGIIAAFEAAGFEVEP